MIRFLFLILFSFQLVFTQTKTKNKLEYQLINTEQYDESVIKILYSQPDSTGLQKPELFLTYENILDKNGVSILPFNEYGEMGGEKRPVRNFIQYADNLKYFGVRVCIIPASQDSLGKDIFFLYDNKGKLQYKNEFETADENIEWQFYITNSGQVIKYNCMKGIFRILDLSGTIINEFSLPVQNDYNNSRYFDLKYSDNGEYIAVSYRDRDSEQDLPIFITYLLNKEFKMVKKYKLDNVGTDDIYISANGRYLITSSFLIGKDGFSTEMKAYVIDTEFDKINIINDFFVNRGVKFINDNLIVLNGSNETIIYDKVQDSILYKLNHKRCLKIDYAPDTKLLFIFDARIANVETTAYGLMKLRVFDTSLPLNDRPIYIKEFDNYKSKQRGDINLKCDNTGDTFIFSLENTVYTYQRIK